MYAGWYPAALDNCPFCALSPDRITLENKYAVAFRDGYPVAQRHTLVIPRLHVTSVFDLRPAEQAAVWDLVAQARAQLADTLRPDAFTIGINDGLAAGQTVPHAHIHVIPRWSGDVPDPRGGVRWVIPGKAAYWVKL
jgi:diadenosine tetraphosphate (Ap4A) HIT family hydrolase